METVATIDGRLLLGRLQGKCITMPNFSLCLDLSGEIEVRQQESWINRGLHQLLSVVSHTVGIPTAIIEIRITTFA